jgi:hypothetical protein
VRFLRVYTLAGIVLLALLFPLLWARMIANPADRTGSDFIAFFAAGRVSQIHGMPQAYDPDLQQAVEEQQVGFPLAPGQVLLYNHVPYLLPLLATLVDGDYVASFVRWVLILSILLLAGVVCLDRLAGRGRFEKAERIALSAGLFLFYPFLVCLMNGQDSAFAVLGLAIFVYGFFTGRERLAGLGLALTTVRPQLAIFLALPFLFHGRKVLLWFFAGSALLILASLFVLGPAGMRAFVDLLLVTAGGEWYGLKEPLMLNLIGLLWRTLPGLGAETIRTIGWTAFAAAVVGFCLLWRLRPRVEAREVALLVIAAVFFSPHLHYHDLSLLVIPLFLLAVDLVRTGRLLPRQVVLVPLTASLWLLFSGFSEWTRLGAPYLLMAGILLLFVERVRTRLFPGKVPE